ncbi:DMT family transporter [Halobellus inordinatus]|uniref:DMT family transporter n=1 Tax=Halobellus inordinatus TaxID=1126236 RepID=UPI0021151F1C|nr:DMT family transporter [Halobellus ramosii]
MIEALLAVAVAGNGAVLTKLLIAFLLAIGGIGTFWFCYTIGIDFRAAIIAGLVLTLGPLTFNKVVAGHYLYLFSYALTPIILTLALRGVGAVSYKNGTQEDRHTVNSPGIDQVSLLVGAVIYGVAWAQFQFAVLIPGLLILFVPALLLGRTELSHRHVLSRTFGLLGLYIAIGLLMQAYWVLSFLFPSGSSVPLDRIAPLTYYEIRNAPALGEALVAIGYSHPYDYTRLAERMLSPWVLPLLYLQAAVAVAGLAVRRYRSVAVPAALSMLAGLFFLPAVNGPLGNAWATIYLSIPPMRLFREVYHFAALIGLPTAVLFGIAIDGGLRITRSRRQEIGVIALATIVVLAAGTPVLSGDFLGQTQTYQYPDGTRTTYESLTAADDKGRTLYLPSAQPIQYPGQRYPGIDPLIKQSPRPTFTQEVLRNDHLDRYGEYATLLARQGHTDDAGILLKTIGTDRVVVRKTVESRYLYFVESTYEERQIWSGEFAPKFTSSDEFETMREADNITIFRPRDASPFVAAHGPPTAVIGDLRTVAELGRAADPIVFVPSAGVSPEDTVDRADAVIIDGDVPPSLGTSDAVQVTFPAKGIDPREGWSPVRYAWWRVDAIAAQTHHYGSTTVMTSSYDNISGEVEPTPKDLIANWSFEEKDDYDAWNQATGRYGFQSEQSLSTTNGTLKAELSAIQPGWALIRSPSVPINATDPHRIAVSIEGSPAHNVHMKVAELDSDGDILGRERILTVGDGQFDKDHLTAEYRPRSASTTALRIEIWHGAETPYSLPNQVRIDDVQVHNMGDYSRPVTTTATATVDDAGPYNAFMRHYSGQQGGSLTISVGDKQTTLDTDGGPGRFKWTSLGTINLSSGDHEIQLTNDRGTNSVSEVVLVPAALTPSFDDALANKRVVYPLSAETDLVQRGGTNTTAEGVVRYNFDGQSEGPVDIVRGGTYRLVLRGEGPLYTMIDGERISLKSHGDGAQVASVNLAPGKHRVTVGATARPVANVTVDSRNVSDPFWSSYSASESDDVPRDGESLRVETDSTETGRWSFVRTAAIPVNPGEQYGVETKMKLSNTVQSHINVEGYDPGSDSWRLISQVPTGRDGTTGWQTYRDTVAIPDDVTRIRFALNAGWQQSPARGPAVTWFANATLYRATETRLTSAFLYKNPTAGKPIDSSAPPTLRSLLGGKAGEGPGDEPTSATVSDVERVSETRWEVKVEANRSFMLTFGEAYDPRWLAEVKAPDGTVQTLQPEPVSGAIDGYWIDYKGSGEYTVTLRYLPQRQFLMGGLVSALTLLSLIGYIGWKVRRRE